MKISAFCILFSLLFLSGVLAQGKVGSSQNSDEETHRQDFIQFDLNNDGNVDAFEIREVVPTIGQQEITTFFIVADKNENGLIDFDEYMHASLSYTDEQFKEMAKDPYSQN
ncbi:unnamed protein product [Moneuplotes crassus]|uniref:EF-hand domain-containing protein n=1 Tax=Euplotes crassus TaxID=5936 RepID=A0AAD2D9L3_EUPCR|nr:unnamed protein product [Moneuplotes crassus]